MLLIDCILVDPSQAAKDKSNPEHLKLMMIIGMTESNHGDAHCNYTTL